MSRKPTAVSEAMRVSARNASDRTTLLAAATFLTEMVPQHRRAQTFVKILVFEGAGRVRAYDVYHQGRDVIDPQRPGFVSVQAADGPSDETTVQMLLDDMNLAIADRTHNQTDQANWGNYQFIVRANNNQQPAQLVFEDRSNVVYIVNAVDHVAGVTQADVTRFVQTAAEEIHRSTGAWRMDNQALRGLLGALADAGDDLVTDRIGPLLPGWTAERDAARREDAEPEEEGPEEEEPEEEEPEEEEPEEEEPEEEPDEEPDDEEPEETPPAENGTPIGRLRILGELAPGQPGWNDEHAALLSPLTLAEVTDAIAALPDAVQQAISQRIQGRALRYRHIDGGQPTGNRRDLYDQVYRNYVRGFYIFGDQQDVTWMQTRQQRGSAVASPQVVHMAGIRRDMFERMVAANGGNRWVKDFYNATASGRFAAQRHVLYDPAGYFGQQETQAQQAGTQQGARAGAQQSGAQLTPEQREAARQERVRLYLLQNILARLRSNVVGRNVRFHIRSQRRPNVYYYKGGSTHRVNRGRQFSDQAARALAAHFDDWEITYDHPDGSHTWQYNADRGIADTIRRIMNPAEYPLPRELQPGGDMTAEDRERLDRAVAAVNERLAGTGIDVQVLLPGQTPDYTPYSGIGSAQGEGFPRDKNAHFAVMFAGMDRQKFVGDDALRFIDELDMGRILRPALEAAQEVYENIVPVVCLDNGCPA